MPLTRQTSRLLRNHRNNTDGLTMITWQADKALSWDTTVICSLAESYVEAAARNAGTVAEKAAAHLRQQSTLCLLQWNHILATTFLSVLINILHTFQVILKKALPFLTAVCTGYGILMLPCFMIPLSIRWQGLSFQLKTFCNWSNFCSFLRITCYQMSKITTVLHTTMVG